MSEMIERAAREVEDEYCLIYGKRCSTETARRLVTRTIAAMREPTKAMVDALTVGGWRPAIDEALK